VIRPKEQATRPRVLLWVNRVGLTLRPSLPVCPQQQTSWTKSHHFRKVPKAEVVDKQKAKAE